MSLFQVVSAYIVDWVVEGEFVEDTQYFDSVWYVVAILSDGRELCHNTQFVDKDAGRGRDQGKDDAMTLAQRVEAHGWIDDDHWYQDEFFGRTLQYRLGQEAEHEELHRKGLGNLSKGVYSGGHV